MRFLYFYFTLSYYRSRQIPNIAICHAVTPPFVSSRISWHFIWLLSIKLGSWSYWLWYQCPSQVLALLTKRDSGLLLDIFQYGCSKLKQGGGVTSHDFIWLLGVILGLWACWRWYQCSSQVLILLTKQDSGLLQDIFQNHCQKQKQLGGVMSCHSIW